MQHRIGRGQCVGLVPDGIAGIFRCTRTAETVYLKERKGLAKLSLQTGTPLVAAYSFGNTDCFTCLYDSWGVMERLSRKAQASIFLFYGRFGLMIPRRVNISCVLRMRLHGPHNDARARARQRAHTHHAALTSPSC